jgi:hypothetical protein
VSSGCVALALAWVRDTGEFSVSDASSMAADCPILVLFQFLVLFLAISLFFPFPRAIPYKLKIRFPRISVRFAYNALCT